MGISEKNAIYWVTRNVGNGAINGHANHHFIALTFDDEDTCVNFCNNYDVIDKRVQSNESNTESIYFVTLGMKTDKHNKMEVGYNMDSDISALKEIIDPDLVSFFKWDWDGDAKELPNYPKSIEILQNEIIKNSINFMKCYNEGFKISYDVNDQNCATWVNTLLKSIDISSDDRKKISDHNGIDWGENDLFDEGFFHGKPTNEEFEISDKSLINGKLAPDAGNLKVKGHSKLSEVIPDVDDIWIESSGILYTYRIKVRGGGPKRKHKLIPSTSALKLKFTDDSGDTYKLSLVIHKHREHYVDFNSSSPMIKKITWKID